MSDLKGTNIAGESVYDFKASLQPIALKEESLKPTPLGSTSDFERSLGLDTPAYKPLVEETPVTPVVSKSTTDTNLKPATINLVSYSTPGVTPVIEPVVTAPVVAKPIVTPPPPPVETVVKAPIAPKPVVSNEPVEIEEVLDSVKNYIEGEMIEGIVTRVDKSGVHVDINFKSEGYIPNSEIFDGDKIKEGDTIIAYLAKLETKEGYTLLSKKIADIENAWITLHDAENTRASVDVQVISTVPGGLVVDFFSIRGFIPASHVLKDQHGKLEDFIGSTIPAVVMQLDKRRRKLMLSHRHATAHSGSPKKLELLNELEAGQVRNGKVSSIKDFGAFVDLGGIEGLIHISELSWSHINHPSEVLKIGQKLDCFVLGIDKEAKKISLGLKQLQSDPWVTIGEKYHVGQLVEGTVARIATFGAFIRLDDGIEGLAHISELSDHHIKTPEEAVQVGQKIKVKIIRILPEEQRIGLSLRDLVDESANLVAYQEQEQKQEKSENSGPKLGDLFPKQEMAKTSM